MTRMNEYSYSHLVKHHDEMSGKFEATDTSKPISTDKFRIIRIDDAQALKRIM